MVNNEFVGDVSVVYPNDNFTGAPLYLVTHKKAPTCSTAISGFAFPSAQICVPATCVFYKNKDCTLSGVGDDHFFTSPADVETLHALANSTCDSYMCGAVKDMAHVVGDTTSARTNSEGGHWGVVSRS
ncbi:hypothetical protein N0V86_005508 [Didymella sp. IMI 355093]|nr:hypothetical protein N0V86_005508 [Didymella sp. IMI 355093]